MKRTILIIFAPVFTLAVIQCRRDEKPIQSSDQCNGVPIVAEARPQNGVFILHGGYTNITLELENGRYRYWFESDSKGANEPDYPLEGLYTITDNTIRLEHSEISAPYREWRFRSLNGVVTLWSKDTSDFKPVSHELIDGGRPRYFLQTFEEFLKRGTGAHVSGTILVPKKTQ